MANRDDSKGAHGGDTGPTKLAGKGSQAEKKDRCRETQPHGGPTRPGAQGTESEHDKRSGGESNGSR